MSEESNRPLVSFVIVTRNREKELAKAIESILKQSYRPIEVIVVNNGSTDNTGEMLTTRFPDAPFISHINLGGNLGVAQGRNEGIKEASGGIVVIIDDDAELAGEDIVEKIVSRFEKNARVGILGFKSVNYYSKEIDSKEFPHRDNSMPKDKEFETSYFVGVGHAVKREVFERVGLYANYFPYYGEELDFSFRTLEEGYRIIYFPGAKVLHKVSPGGRVKGGKYWEKTLENRIRTSIRNLPWRYVVVSSFIWSGIVLVKSGLNLVAMTRAYWAIFRDIGQLVKERKVIRPETIERVKRLRGRLYY